MMIFLRLVYVVSGPRSPCAAKHIVSRTCVTKSAMVDGLGGASVDWVTSPHCGCQPASEGASRPPLTGWAELVPRPCESGCPVPPRSGAFALAVSIVFVWCLADGSGYLVSIIFFVLVVVVVVVVFVCVSLFVIVGLIVVVGFRGAGLPLHVSWVAVFW